MIIKNLFKIFLFILICLDLNSQAIAGTIKIDRFSPPINLENRILQPLNINILSEGNWKIQIQPLENRIINQDNPNYSIPITRLELQQQNGIPVTNFNAGKVYEINSFQNNNSNNVNLSISTKYFNNDRPGTYSTDIKVTLIDTNNIPTEEFYNLRFKIDEKASLEFLQKTSFIKLTKEQILRKGSTQNLDNLVGIYVSSNKDWKLYMTKIPNENDDKLKYLLKVIGEDSSINYKNNTDYIPIFNNQKILLATGKATFNDSIQNLDKKLINIDYILKTPENEYLQPGNYTSDFEYKLETEE